MMIAAAATFSREVFVNAAIAAIRAARRRRGGAAS